jgi:hypothetical protein
LIAGIFAARKNGRHTRSHRTFTNYELPITGNLSDLSDFHARDIRNRIEASGDSIERDAEIARSGFGWLSLGAGCD